MTDLRAARRAALLDAADRVIRAAGPDASMSAIAAEAGVTKPILYRHFGDKGGLYRALAERYVSPLVAEVRRRLAAPGDRRARLAATIDAYLAFIESEPQIYRFLLHRALAEHPEASAAVSAAIRRVGDEVGTALEDALGLPPAQAASWGHGIVGMVHVAGDWWQAERPLPRADLVAHLTALLWQGLATPGAASAR
jgi:AcrR family transcriptional regulator